MTSIPRSYRPLVALLAFSGIAVFVMLGGIRMEPASSPKAARPANVQQSPNDQEPHDRTARIDLSSSQGGDRSMVSRTQIDPDQGSFLGRINAYHVEALGQSEAPYACRIMLRQKGGRSLSVELKEGQWEGLLPKGTYSVEGVTGENEVPDFEPSSDLTPAAPSIRVDIRRAQSWRISVLDAHSGAHLSKVDIHSVNPEQGDPMALFRANRWRIPSDGLVQLIAGATSPISVPEQQSMGYFWVSAPGYAPVALERNSFQRHWQVDLHRQGSLTIEVGSALGDLITDFSRRGIRAEPWIRVETAPAQEIVLSEPIGSKRSFALERLPAGQYAVSVQLESEDFLQAEPFRRRFHLRAGQYETILLDPLGDSWEGECSSLTIRIVLPDVPHNRKSWNVNLLYSNADTSEFMPIAHGGLERFEPSNNGLVHHRTFISIPQGRYELVVQPTGHRFQFDLGIEAEEVTADCSDTGLVNVSIKDRQDLHESLSAIYGYVDPGHADANRRTRIRMRTDEIQLLCRPDPIHFQLIGMRKSSKPITISPTAGEATTVQVEMGSSELPLLRLTAWSQGSHASVDSSFWNQVKVTPVGHEGKLIEKRFGKHGTAAQYGHRVTAPDWAQCVLAFSAPGLYRLRTAEGLESTEVLITAGLSDHPLRLD